MQPLSNFLIWILGLATLVLGLLAGAAQADVKSFSGAETAPEIAEFYVHQNGVDVALEIFPGDLSVFQDLLPDRMLRVPPVDRPSQPERLSRFSIDGLSIRDGNGVVLQAQLKRLELRERTPRYSPYAGLRNPVTGQKNPEPPADSRVIYVELYYPFSGERPDVLEFSPPTAPTGLPSATIGFLAHHRTVTVNDFRYLSRPERINLDWDDPWYTAFDRPSLRRHYRHAMTSFLYVEPRQVRHELLLRVQDLGQWINLDLDGAEAISPDAQDRLIRQISNFVATKNPLRVNGTLIAPDNISTDFVTIEPQGIVAQDTSRPIDPLTAMVGVILTSQVDALPDTVTVDWELFTDRQSRVYTNTIDPAGPFNGFVEPDDTMIVWQNHLTSYEEPVITPAVIGDERTVDVPVLTTILLFGAVVIGAVFLRTTTPGRTAKLALVCVVALTALGSLKTGWVRFENPLAPIPDAATARKATAQVIENLHTALRETSPERLADALAPTVSAESADDIRLELERGLTIKVQGGSAATVEGVEDLELTNIGPLQGSRGFQAKTNWTVQASGNHWGHPHKKTVHFTALIDMSPIDGLWKLTGITVTSAQVGS